MDAFATPYELSSLDFYRQNHGQQLYYNWSGSISWIKAPEEPAQPLCDIIGMNATKVLLKDDPEEGEVGYRLNREIGLFCDPVTQTPLKTWTTPQGEIVPVIHIANRMVQGALREKIIVIPAGQGCLTQTKEIPLEYPHPLAQDPNYRDHCPGPTFQGVEYFTSSFVRPGFTDVPPARWARDCPWLPWMKLGYGHPARLRFETTIQRVDAFEDLHPTLIQMVRSRLPLYEFTPDACDEPNMTSLLYFRTHFEAYQRGETFPIEERA